jgi:hypothetical protein
MKRLIFGTGISLITVVMALTAYADCSSGSWTTKTFGGVDILYRMCELQDKFSILDVKNPNSYPICYTVEAPHAKEKWSDWQLETNKTATWTVSKTGEDWMLYKVYKPTKSYCG